MKKETFEEMQERMALLETRLKEQESCNHRNSRFLQLKNLAAVALVFLAGSAWLFGDTFELPHVFQNEAILSEKDLNVSFNAIRDHLNLTQVPVGVILAFHRDFAGHTLELPEGYVECNGQEILTEGSALKGELTPNLNGAVGVNSPGHTTPERMFLRGGTTSGVGETDLFQTHGHGSSIRVVAPAPPYVPPCTPGGKPGTPVCPPNTPGATTDDGFSFARGINPSDISGAANVKEPTPSPGTSLRKGSETRPKSMSIIWIMRIK